MNPENQKLLAEIRNGTQAFDLPRFRTEWVSADRIRTQKQPAAVSIVPEIRRSAFIAADIEMEATNEDLAHQYFSPGKTFIRRPPNQEMYD
jgi:hypothetical protein